MTLKIGMNPSNLPLIAINAMETLIMLESSWVQMQTTPATTAWAMWLI